MAVISIVVACRDKYWNNEHYNYFNRFQYQTPAALRSNEISNTAIMRLRIKFNTLSPISFVIKYAKKYSYYFFKTLARCQCYSHCALLCGNVWRNVGLHEKLRCYWKMIVLYYPNKQESIVTICKKITH